MSKSPPKNSATQMALDAAAIFVMVGFGVIIVGACVWIVFGIIYGAWQSAQRDEVAWLVAGLTLSLAGVLVLWVFERLWDRVEPWIVSRLGEDEEMTKRQVNIRSVFIGAGGELTEGGLPLWLEDNERIVNIDHEGAQVWVYIERDEGE